MAFCGFGGCAPASPIQPSRWNRQRSAAACAPIQPSRETHLSPPAAAVVQNTLRYGYFRTTVRSLAAKLAVCPRTVWLGLNYRADWSLNELRLNRKLFVPRIKPNVLLKNVKLPLKWDWSSRADDKVTPAKDQGRCGSCFAFAAVAAVESKLLIQYGKKFSEYAVDLSEQQMVDCVVPSQGNYYSDGCGGGYLEEPLVYASRCGWNSV